MLLRKAHCCRRTGRLRIGKVTVTVWPKQLLAVAEKHNIYVLKQHRVESVHEGRRRPPFCFR